MDLFNAFFSAIDRLDPDITAFLNQFSDPHVPLRLSLAIAAVAILLLAVLVVWGGAALWRIARLRRFVRQTGTGSDFTVNFRRIDVALLHSLFSKSWIEYRECLKKTEERIFYTRRPEEYFGLQAVESASFPVRFFAAVHGYFIGVGLLFTFVGLVAALKFAAAGVTSTDVATAKEALNGLLSAASFKFMTSIAGLGCSLVLSIAARSMTYAIEGATHGLAAVLEQGMAPIYAESMAYDQLGLARQQLAQLDKLAGSLEAAARSPAVEHAMAIERAPVVDNTAATHEGLERVLNAFLAELRGSAGIEMKQLAGKLADIGGAIARMQTHIGQSGHGFAEQIGGAASRLVEAAATVEQRLDARVDAIAGKIDALGASFARGEAVFAGAADQAARGMALSLKGAGDEVARGVAAATKGLVATTDGLAQRLDGIVGGLDRFETNLAAQTQAMGTIVAALGGAREALDDSAATWQRASEPVTGAVTQSREVAGELKAVAERVASAQHDMAAMAKAVAQLSEKTNVVWDNYRSRFEKVDTDLEAVFERLQGGTRAFGKEVMEFVGKLDASLAEGMQALSVGTEELREVAEILLVDARKKAA
jgi:uncharacterized protein YoxC